MEEVEEAVLRVGAGVPVHLRHLQLQGQEVRPGGDAAARRIHSGLHRAGRRYSTVQYSTVQYSTVQNSTVQYSTVHMPYSHIPVYAGVVCLVQAP